MYANPLTQPGFITSSNSEVISGVYSNQGQNQTFTIDLTGVSVSQFQNYHLIINGSLLIFVYPGNAGVTDLAAKLANRLNEFGFFWCNVINPTTIQLVARVVGTNYTIEKGLNLTPATVTQTLPGITPVPLTPGTLLFFDIRKDVTAQLVSDHDYVTTYDQVFGVSGFNIRRHCAGILVAEESNDGISELINRSNLRLLRRGEITYRNYGTQADRTKLLTFNGSSPTALLPGGALGVGLNTALGTNLENLILSTSYVQSNQIGTLRISL